MLLYIDSYDLFSNNVIDKLKSVSEEEIIRIQNDSVIESEVKEFLETLSYFSSIIIGPGPGDPTKIKDVGIIKKILEKMKKSSLEESIPIFGICLGFQSICHEFESDVKKLKTPKHGQISQILTEKDDADLSLFNKNSSEKYNGVRYHSFAVENVLDPLRTLAYCFDLSNDGVKKKIIMAVRHKFLPIYAVQFHPESICSSNADELFSNFFQIASKHNKKFAKESLLKDFEQKKPQNFEKFYSIKNTFYKSIVPYKNNILHSFHYKKKKIPNHLSFLFLCNSLKNQFSHNFILLNSQKKKSQWSILGFLIKDETQILTHSLNTPNLLEESIFQSSIDDKKKILLDVHSSLWKYLTLKINDKYIPKQIFKDILRDEYDDELPFYSGFMGFFSYEENNLDNFDKNGFFENNVAPDMKLAFIERCLIYNHTSNSLFLVSTRSAETSESFITLENNLNQIFSSKADLNYDHLPSFPCSIEYPSKEIYMKQFEECVKCLENGESYELCLTTHAIIDFSSEMDPWDLYLSLARTNPAPRAAFVSFDDCALVSCSPELFLSASHTSSSLLILSSPIKGSLRKENNIDLASATRLLNNPKDIAENLMIVDLTRNDLLFFSRRVFVQNLFYVQELPTLYHLVSTITAPVNPNGPIGPSLLSHSLPPGSMTGAPKKNSVSLLKKIESKQPTTSKVKRGLYSGVVGYFSITDESDWSVIIRSLFHYSIDPKNSIYTHRWRMGSGGAITLQSDPLSEWDEMILKYESVLNSFLKTS